MKPRRTSNALFHGVCGIACLLLAWQVFAQPPAAPPPAQQLPGGRFEHLFKLSDKLYSGSQPEGEAAFRQLAEMGVKTIISVDGARTDVETARRFGIRYVHVPIGYHGFSQDDAVKMLKAVSELPQPAFIHCHHGKHRGPAAAAVCARAIDGWSVEQALAFLQQAGTSPSYRGLFATVRQTEIPTAAALRALKIDLPERIEPQSVVAAMIVVDLTAARLEELAKNDFRPLADKPDLAADHEALQLVEHYREMGRLPEVRMRDDDLQLLLRQSEQRAGELHQLLRREQNNLAGEKLAAAQRLHASIRQDCRTCHAQFRDAP